MGTIEFDTTLTFYDENNNDKYDAGDRLDPAEYRTQVEEYLGKPLGEILNLQAAADFYGDFRNVEFALGDQLGERENCIDQGRLKVLRDSLKTNAQAAGIYSPALQKKIDAVLEGRVNPNGPYWTEELEKVKKAVRTPGITWQGLRQSYAELSRFPTCGNGSLSVVVDKVMQDVAALWVSKYLDAPQDQLPPIGNEKNNGRIVFELWDLDDTYQVKNQREITITFSQTAKWNAFLKRRDELHSLEVDSLMDTARNVLKQRLVSGVKKRQSLDQLIALFEGMMDSLDHIDAKRRDRLDFIPKIRSVLDQARKWAGMDHDVQRKLHEIRRRLDAPLP